MQELRTYKSSDSFQKIPLIYWVIIENRTGPSSVKKIPFIYCVTIELKIGPSSGEKKFFFIEWTSYIYICSTSVKNCHLFIV